MDNYTIELKFDQAEQPKFKEVKGKGYVEFGEDNNYPTYLLSLFNESPKHAGIVKGKENYIYGQGFDSSSIVNSMGETWNDLLKKVVKDDELYRGYYFQIIWNRLKQVSEIYHIEFHKVRVSKDLNEFYVKNNWMDYREKARCYPAFNLSNPIGSQILYVKEYNPSSEIYPYPSYFQALNYIESDIQVSRHILGNAKQGFVGSKLVSLNNGSPETEEKKEEVERGILKKFTGSEGRRTVIVFNKSRDNAPEIADLGQSMLTKEDFTNVNKLIQTEIYAAHQITSSQLFGIAGDSAFSRNEIKDAYEVFNNTYVKSRQQEFEKIFNKLGQLKGEQTELKITPVQPLKFEFSETIMAANLTQNEIRELMGKEPLNNGQVTSDGAVAVQNEIKLDTNDSLKNLTGRQYQNVMRIVRQFGQGKLSKVQASLMLKNGFGFTDQDVNDFLGIDENPLTQDEIVKFSASPDDLLLKGFEEFFDLKEDFEILSEKPVRDYFAEVQDLNALETKILGLIEKQKNIDIPTIAKVVNESQSVVDAVVKDLTDRKIIEEKVVKIGPDESIERKLSKPLSELTKKQPATTSMQIRYTYVGPEDSRNRPFCAKMLDLARTKVWSRSNIEAISERLGYSVWDRRGGWFTEPDGSHRPYCRHSWKMLIVKKK